MQCKREPLTRRTRQPDKLIGSLWQDIKVMMRYEYDAVLHELPEKGGAYVAFPWDLKKRERDG